MLIIFIDINNNYKMEIKWIGQNNNIKNFNLKINMIANKNKKNLANKNKIVK
jgi:hypothetical protein